ncbi:MAG TPA: hypothetical protein EYQ69_03900 [Gemmatimonadetes bacterium]|nr:hypothetical protein [Gemmatimonadota bacterium]
MSKVIFNSLQRQAVPVSPEDLELMLQDEIKEYRYTVSNNLIKEGESSESAVDNIAKVLKAEVEAVVTTARGLMDGAAAEMNLTKDIASLQPGKENIDDLQAWAYFSLGPCDMLLDESLEALRQINGIVNEKSDLDDLETQQDVARFLGCISFLAKPNSWLPGVGDIVAAFDGVDESFFDIKTDTSAVQAAVQLASAINGNAQNINDTLGVADVIMDALDIQLATSTTPDEYVSKWTNYAQEANKFLTRLESFGVVDVDNAAESRIRGMIHDLLLERMTSMVSNDVEERVALPGWERMVDDVPVGQCNLDGSEDEKGGTHSFHGNNMVPCGAGEGGMNVGKGGPYLGNDSIQGKDVEIAQKYLDRFEPDALVAYSRGAAIAQQAGNTPGDVTYLAPAWGRTYGTDTDVSGPGKIYHGGSDRFVPLKNSCDAAQNSGMDLYVAPDRGHGGVLSDYKSGNTNGYQKMSAGDIKKCAEELDSWDSGEYPDQNDDRVDRQNGWVDRLRTPVSEAKEKALRRLIRKAIKNYKQ